MKKTPLLAVICIMTGLIFTACSPQQSTPSPVQPSPIPATTPATNGPVMKESTSDTSIMQGSYSLADISQHASPTDCWTAINGEVYNLTSFVSQHPGGRSILQVCGKDGTSLFNSQHGQQQLDFAQQFKIGKLTQ